MDEILETKVNVECRQSRVFTPPACGKKSKVSFADLKFTNYPKAGGGVGIAVWTKCPNCKKNVKVIKRDLTAEQIEYIEAQLLAKRLANANADAQGKK